jgi:hypothetical protein
LVRLVRLHIKGVSSFPYTTKEIVSAGAAAPTLVASARGYSAKPAREERLAPFLMPMVVKMVVKPDLVWSFRGEEPFN